MTIKTNGWAVQCNIGKSPSLWPEAHRLRKEAKESFRKIWTLKKDADKRIKDGRYKIVRVRIEVIS